MTYDEAVDEVVENARVRYEDAKSHLDRCVTSGNKREIDRASRHMVRTQATYNNARAGTLDDHQQMRVNLIVYTTNLHAETTP